jgi:hypothetical protein
VSLLCCNITSSVRKFALRVVFLLFITDYYNNLHIFCPIRIVFDAVAIYNKKVVNVPNGVLVSRISIWGLRPVHK